MSSGSDSRFVSVHSSSEVAVDQVKKCYQTTPTIVPLSRLEQYRQLVAKEVADKRLAEYRLIVRKDKRAKRYVEYEKQWHISMAARNKEILTWTRNMFNSNADQDWETPPTQKEIDDYQRKQDYEKQNAVNVIKNNGKRGTTRDRGPAHRAKGNAKY
jgi:hypothetical protein